MSGNITPPAMEQTPVKNETAEAMGTLGMLTMGCELGDPLKKSKCQEIIKPLEQGKENAVETMTNMIVEFGPEFLDEAMDNFNMVAFEATTRAKDMLIEKGMLNPDGSQKE